MDTRRKSTTFLNNEGINKENASNKSKRSKSLGGSSLPRDGDDDDNGDESDALTPSKLARRKAKPRRSILKPQHLPEHSDDDDDEQEEEQKPKKSVKIVPRKSEASRRVSFASHCFIRLFEDEDGNKQPSSSPRKSPSPKKQRSSSPRKSNSDSPTNHHNAQAHDSDTSDMSIASQEVTTAFKKAMERKRPLDGSDTESDDDPAQTENNNDDNDDATMDLTEAVGGVLKKGAEHQHHQQGDQKHAKSPKKSVSHSPTRKSPRLSSQNASAGGAPASPLESRQNKDTGNTGDTGDTKDTDETSENQHPPMQLPTFTLSPTASEKQNGSDEEGEGNSNSNSESDEEADTTMDFTVSMSQAGVPKLPQFETGRRRSSLDRRSSVIKQNSRSPEGPRGGAQPALHVENSSSSSSDDDEEADQHMLSQPPPPPPPQAQSQFQDSSSRGEATSDSDNDDGDDMDLTKAVTTHIDQNLTTVNPTHSADAQQPADESMAMEMTQNVGGLLNSAQAQDQDSSDDDDNAEQSAVDMSLASTSNAHNDESMTMEMTQAVGGFTNFPAIPEESSESSSDDDNGIDATMTMDITKPVGRGILVNEETRRLRKSLAPRASRVSFAPSVIASPENKADKADKSGPRPSIKSALKGSSNTYVPPPPGGKKRSSFSAPTQSSLLKKGGKGVRHSLGGALGGASTSASATNSPLRSALKNAAKSPKRASVAGELTQDTAAASTSASSPQQPKNMSPLVQRLQLASPLRPPPLKLDKGKEKDGDGEGMDLSEGRKSHKPRRRSSLALSAQALEATPDTLASEKEKEEQLKNEREKAYEKELEEERRRKHGQTASPAAPSKGTAMNVDRPAPESQQGTPRRRSLHAQQMTPSKLRRSLSATNMDSPMTTPKRQSLRLAAGVTTPLVEAFAGAAEEEKAMQQPPSPQPAARDEFAAGAETERMIEGLMQEEEDDNANSSVEAPVQISLNDFLDLTDMKFLDGISTIKRRSTVGIGGLSGLKTPTHQPSSLDYLRAHTVTGPKLEMMYWCCHELKRYISEGIEALNSYEREVDNENPPVIVDYLLASEDMRVRIEAQLKIVKNNSRLDAKRVWYGWRKELVSGHLESLNDSFKSLEKDQVTLQETRAALGDRMPQLHSLKEKLETELRREREIVRDLASCDKAEVEGLREAIAEQAQPLELYKAEIASNNEEIDRLRSRVEAKKEALANDRNTIESNRREWDMVRCLTKAEAMKRRREYESLQSLHSWHIVHLSSEAQKLHYSDDLIVSITKQGIELSLLPEKKGELRPLSEYLLDCLRGQLTEEGISQDGELSYTLQRISTLWINVKNVHAQFKRLAQVYKLTFNVSIEGDLVVGLSIVYTSTMRKLHFEIVVGSDLLVDFDNALKNAKVQTHVVAGADVDTDGITQSLLKHFSSDDGILEAFEDISI
ncbi:hypothetical protein E3P99_02751 [Wallemia hederae]|uniref:Spc7 kinetochore protein domain-containing protein n=1 Tax=Wallemia hederae TaxID=1540922 RepID=A0A4T0FL11_9BASI|nr:hypothetical protein E3P99_02751 [Wallemia hederae]